MARPQAHFTAAELARFGSGSAWAVAPSSFGSRSCGCSGAECSCAMRRGPTAEDTAMLLSPGMAPEARRDIEMATMPKTGQSRQQSRASEQHRVSGAVAGHPGYNPYPGTIHEHLPPPPAASMSCGCAGSRCKCRPRRSTSNHLPERTCHNPYGGVDLVPIQAGTMESEEPAQLAKSQARPQPVTAQAP